MSSLSLFYCLNLSRSLRPSDFFSFFFYNHILSKSIHAGKHRLRAFPTAAVSLPIPTLSTLHIFSRNVPREIEHKYPVYWRNSFMLWGVNRVRQCFLGFRIRDLMRFFFFTKASGTCPELSFQCKVPFGLLSNLLCIFFPSPLVCERMGKYVILLMIVSYLCSDILFEMFPFC